MKTFLFFFTLHIFEDTCDNMCQLGQPDFSKNIFLNLDADNKLIKLPSQFYNKKLEIILQKKYNSFWEYY